MKIFKHRRFQQWAKQESLKDTVLKKAVDELMAGLHDGNLGSGLYKKRIAMPGGGKRGGYRALLAFKCDERAFFLYGFAKNVIENINDKEKLVYKCLAKELLNLSDQTLGKMLKASSLIEVK